jgi:competence protein ComEA
VLPNTRSRNFWPFKEAIGGIAIHLFWQENCRRVFSLCRHDVFAGMIYEIVTKEENDPVKLIQRFAAARILITLALLPVPMAFAQPPQKPTAHSAPVATPEDRVDINTATVDQLLKVPGMTRTWAARIVRNRPYRGKNELLDHGIVTREVYDRIKDYIVAHRPAQ